MTSRLHVVAGVLRDSIGRVLITERPVGKPLALHWEFPGGKLRHGEDARSGLERELREELGIELRVCTPLIRYQYAYPDRVVDLDVYEVDHYDGVAVGLEGQRLSWLPPGELSSVNILQADLPILTTLQLPSRYIITPTKLQSVQQVIACIAKLQPPTLIQLRLPTTAWADYRKFVLELSDRTNMASMMLNGDPEKTLSLAREVGAAGIHIPARYLPDFSRCDRDGWVATSCHDADELNLAVEREVDFVVLGPVRSTQSHPQALPLGWSQFSEIVGPAAIPVYALGGVAPEDIRQARQCGAQGVAGISAFWPG